MTQDSHRTRTERLILLGQKGPSQSWLHAQHGEVVPADELSPQYGRPVRSTDGHWGKRVGDEPGERCALFSIVEEVGIRGVAVELTTTPGREHRDQPLRLGHVERSHEQGVDEAEDGRVGSDAERQGKHGDQSERPVLFENARTVPNVLPHTHHSNPAAARRLRRAITIDTLQPPPVVFHIAKTSLRFRHGFAV